MRETQDEFTQIGTFMYEYEAQILIGRLENEGIQAFIFDNNIIASDPFLANAVGGIKVHIRTEDIEKVRVVLEEIENESSNQHAKSENVKIGNTSYTPFQGECPKCRSTSVYTKAFGFWKWLFSILGAIIGTPMVANNPCICGDCEHQWKTTL